jgi:hypothetical protein
VQVAHLTRQNGTAHEATHPFSMTDLPIQKLNMTDTEYADFIAKGYDPALEQELYEVVKDSIFTIH